MKQVLIFFLFIEMQSFMAHSDLKYLEKFLIKNCIWYILKQTYYRQELHFLPNALSNPSCSHTSLKTEKS